MKGISTLGIVLGLLITSAHLGVAAQGETETSNVEQHAKNIEICTQNLITTGKAIHTYQKEHGDFPVWLSDLHPKHLADGNAFARFQHRGLLIETVHLSQIVPEGVH